MPQKVELPVPAKLDPPPVAKIEPPASPKAEASNPPQQPPAVSLPVVPPPPPAVQPPPPSPVVEVPPAVNPAPKVTAMLETSPSTPPGGTSIGNDGLQSLLFDKDMARLPEETITALKRLATRMTAESGIDVQLLAYAAGDEDSASKARRLSLSRALAVRSFLMDQGIRSTRIEVRALGNKIPDNGPADRVDLVLQKH